VKFLALAQGLALQWPLDVFEQLVIDHHDDADFAKVGDLFETALQFDLIVGFTRLGNILGALDRQDIPETAQHTIWLGRRG
jgi:hypothetical protein